ncbi:hypothetical protein E6W36_15490 [Hankyongella ginsenosidimutans]|uniref:L,D-TPase catalytic domain-containing protein n=1 Tax=Hankyongella ginsenosidimutans TaxID=1763828 RepID=A0A4D7CAR4_9SPHN|nr:hypothetical protein E6W36_15490 [Hankyongella ginsenosidimutans]
MPPQDATYGVLQRGLAGETDPARRQALTATLERRRWLPRGTPARLLLVNIPAYELTFYEAGALVTVHPVIVGQPAHPTPLMQVAAPGITLNPWWNVPDRIAREKLWPKLRRDPRFAASMGYVIDNGRIRQKPGPKMRWVSSSSSCRTGWMSICTIRRTRRCSTVRPARSAMVACGCRQSRPWLRACCRRPNGRPTGWMTRWPPVPPARCPSPRRPLSVRSTKPRRFSRTAVSAS